MGLLSGSEQNKISKPADLVNFKMYIRKILKEWLDISKQVCFTPSKYSLLVLLINFYLHPESQSQI